MLCHSCEHWPFTALINIGALTTISLNPTWLCRGQSKRAVSPTHKGQQIAPHAGRETKRFISSEIISGGPLALSLQLITLLWRRLRQAKLIFLNWTPTPRHVARSFGCWMLVHQTKGNGDWFASTPNVWKRNTAVTFYTQLVYTYVQSGKKGYDRKVRLVGDV